MSTFNAFEQAIEAGEIDLGEFADPYLSAHWLTAYLVLPENDPPAYEVFRKFLAGPGGTSNEKGRKNERQALGWMQSENGADLLHRLQQIAEQYHPNSMAGTVRYQFHQTRMAYRMIQMYLNAPPPLRKSPEEIERERDWEFFIARFKRPPAPFTFDDGEDYDPMDPNDTDPYGDDDGWGRAGPPWGYVPGYRPKSPFNGPKQPRRPAA